MLKNRWSAQIRVDIFSLVDGAAVICHVDMPAGTKHYEVAADIAEAVGDDIFNDRGLSSAVQRLGKAGRLFGRKEVRHLVNLLRHNEQVTELGQGQYGNKLGLVILTDQRLFFLEKSLGSETIEEFPLGSISSLSRNKKVTGETLIVYASGNQAEIRSMGHGQSDALVRAFHTLKSRLGINASSPESAPPLLSTDPVAQLERLAALRDTGVLTVEEFQAKKAEILARM